MTKKEFVEQWRFDFTGMVCDAATNKHTGAPLAMFLREIMRRIDANLGQIYDQLARADKVHPTPSPNGDTKKEAVNR